MKAEVACSWNSSFHIDELIRKFKVLTEARSLRYWLLLIYRHRAVASSENRLTLTRRVDDHLMSFNKMSRLLRLRGHSICLRRWDMGFAGAAESMETCVKRSLLLWPSWSSGAEPCACGYSLSSWGFSPAFWRLPHRCNHWSLGSRGLMGVLSSQSQKDPFTKSCKLKVCLLPLRDESTLLA